MTRHSPRGALVAVSLALFCIQLDFFGLNLAVPDMTRSLSTTTDHVQWVLSAYMLSLGSLFILGGRLGDIFGRRPMLIGGIVVFCAASVLCALAPNLVALVVFRILAGIGAALIFPIGIAVVANAFDDTARAKALGLTFAIANIGTAVGPFVGGGLAEGPGWRWIFWMLVPVTAVSAAIAVLTVGDSREPNAPRRVDILGTVLLVAGLALLSFAIDRSGTWSWGSLRTLGLLAASIALLIVFVVAESRVRNPLIDLSLFRNPPYVLIAALAAVTNIGYGVTIFVATLYLQDVRGLSALVAGIVFLAPAVLVALSGPIGARVKPHAPPSLIMVSASLIGALALAGMTYVQPWLGFVPLFALAGFGFGLGWTFANLATQDIVDTDRAGEASGVLLTVLVSAGGIGLALVAGVIAALERSGHSAQFAYFASLRVVAIATVAWAGLMMLARFALSRRGLVPPLFSPEARGSTSPPPRQP